MIELNIIDDPQQIKSILREILQQRQFAQYVHRADFLWSRYLNKLIEKVDKFLERLFSVFLLRELKWDNFLWFKMFLLLCLLFILCFILWLVVRSLKGMISSGQAIPLTQKQERMVFESVYFERQAQLFEGKGDFLKAMHYYYMAILALLHKKGIIRYDKSKTNREFEEMIVAYQNQGLTNSFSLFSQLFEMNWYGLKPLKYEDWEAFQRYYNSCKTGID